MSKFVLIFVSVFSASLFAAEAPDLSCENNSFRLEIYEKNQKVVVTNIATGESDWLKTTKFKRIGKLERFQVEGTARAVKYQGQPYEENYEGEAVIKSDVALNGDQLVFSAKFLIEYDPYLTVTRWDNCKVKNNPLP